LLSLLTLLSYRCFCLFKKVYFKVATPAEIQFEIKDFYSSKFKKDAEDLFTVYLDNQKKDEFNPDAFSKLLSEKIPVFKSLNWDLDLHKVAKIEICGCLPKFVVNQNFIIAENCKVFPKEYFEQFDNSKLKELTVSPKYCKGEIPECFYQFLQKIPSPIWEEYTINYEKPTFIKLSGIVKKFEIIVDEKAVFDKTKLTKLEDIYQDVENRKLLKKSLKSGTKKLAFDLRFDNRILVSRSV